MSDTTASAPPVIRPHSYPFWVIAFALLVVGATAYSSFSIPSYYRAAKDAADASHAYAAGNIARAESLDREALAIAPSSKKVRITLAKAMFADHDPKNDRDALGLLVGLDIDETEWNDLSTVMPAEYQALFTRHEEH